jgi:hypothetical protein
VLTGEFSRTIENSKSNARVVFSKPGLTCRLVTRRDRYELGAPLQQIQ